MHGRACAPACRVRDADRCPHADRRRGVPMTHGVFLCHQRKSRHRLSRMAARPPFYPPAIAERYPRTHLEKSVPMLCHMKLALMISDNPQRLTNG